jgi:O-antigen ligase
VIALGLAVILIGYPVALFQQRTLYLVLLALFGFLVLFRPAARGHVVVIAALGVFGLALISLSGLRVEGRLGEDLGLNFLVNHFLAIFGICPPGHDMVCAAAAGVPQRLDWWESIFDRMLADPFKLLLGLGYGIVLTDFRSDIDVAVREPHNSYITVLARTGVIGLICWVSMMVVLIRRWYQTFLECSRREWRVGQNRLMILMVFFICMWVLAIGEDGFEKPYNIVPFYFFWGIVLRFSLHLEDGTIGPPAEPRVDRPWELGRLLAR